MIQNKSFGSGKCTGFSRVYRIQESLKGSVEFTYFRKVFRVQGRSLQGYTELKGSEDFIRFR